MKRKLITTILCVGMLVNLTGCVRSEKVSAPGTSDDIWIPMDNEEDTEEIDLTEHAVIVYMTIGDAPTNGATQAMLDQLNRILKEKANAELAICYTGWDDYLTVYDQTLAEANARVDLVGTSSQWLDAWAHVRKGHFLALSEEMLQTYAPMTWESVNAEHWEACKYQDQIYLMPEDHYREWSHPGYTYSRKLAEEAGYSDGIHSWEQLSEYLQYVSRKLPDVSLWKKDEMDAISLCSGWISSHSDFVPIEGLGDGRLWGTGMDDPTTIYSPYMTETESFVEFAKLMKQWSETGVWKEGKVALEDADFFCFGEETQNIWADSVTRGAMAVCASSGHPERALMVYDLLRNDPDCYRLLNYGIQGKQWDLNESGQRVRPDSYEKERDAITTNFWWGRNDDLEIDDEIQSRALIKRRFDRYGQLIREYPYESFRPDLDLVAEKLEKLSAIHAEYMMQIVLGQYEGTAEDIVAQYQRSMREAGMDEVTDNLQSQMNLCISAMPAT